MASYATVETALAKMHGADANAQRGAFRGRLKHLQRLGLPLGDKPGKGKRIEYTQEQVWQLALALELAECGIDPVTIVELISRHWNDKIHPSFTSISAKYKRSQDVLMILNVAFMSASWGPKDSSLNGLQSLSWNDSIASGLLVSRGSNRRAITINVTDMIREIHREIGSDGG